MKSMDPFTFYREVNETNRKKLYFHLGVNAGFFSEFNGMPLAMLYCLERGIKFVRNSTDVNFCVDLGWADFFEPIRDEKNYDAIPLRNILL